MYCPRHWAMFDQDQKGGGQNFGAGRYFCVFLQFTIISQTFQKPFQGELPLGKGRNTVNITFPQYFGFTQAASLQL